MKKVYESMTLFEGTCIARNYCKTKNGIRTLFWCLMPYNLTRILCKFHAIVRICLLSHYS